MDIEVKMSAQKLQGLLMAHDRAVIQINFLDQVIKRHHRQAVRSMTHGRKGQVLHYMGCKSVAEAMRHMYKQYRIRKWIEVQTLAHTIMRTLNPSSIQPPLVVPDNNLDEESHQMERYEQTMTVAFCNFSRTS